MQQFRCNNLLDGVRICLKGYPFKLLYEDFKYKYALLCPNAFPSGTDAKKASQLILKTVSLEADQYKLGLTKIFFKIGGMEQLDSLKDSAQSKIIAMLQARFRAFTVKKKFKKMVEKHFAMNILRRNTKRYLSFKNWDWWNLYVKVKPLLNAARQEVNDLNN